MTTIVAETCLHRLEMRSLTQKHINLSVENVFQVVNGRCVTKEEFFVDGQWFPLITSTSEWQLDVGGDMSYKVSDNLKCFLGKALRLNGDVVQIICDFLGSWSEVEDGVEIIGPFRRLLIDKVVGGKSISQWIADVLMIHWRKMIICEELNAVTGLLEEVPLSRVSFDVQPHFFHIEKYESAFSSTGSANNLQIMYADDMNLHIVCATLHYCGKRGTYSISKLTNLDFTMGNAKFRTKPNMRPFPLFDALRIGGSKHFVELGVIFMRNQGERWFGRF
jgi:hypothetical protein